jgi:hypothetical protein
VILLDTDHLTVLKYTDSDRYALLHGRLLAAAPELIGTTIVNVEEQMRRWLAAIAKERSLSRQISAYRELTDLFDCVAARSGARFRCPTGDFCGSPCCPLAVRSTGHACTSTSPSPVSGG